MKQKLSVSLDNSTVDSIESRIKDGRFRNKSHLIEYAVRKLIKGDTDG